MWDKITENLGSIEAHSHNTVIFTFIGNITIDTKSFAACSCISIDWNENTKVLTTIYIPKAVPQHLKLQLQRTYYTDVKTITFSAKIDNKVLPQNISIIATVFDNLKKQ